MILLSSSDARYDELKRAISSLEWDLNMITDEKIKALKRERLTAYKTELGELRKALDTENA